MRILLVEDDGLLGAAVRDSIAAEGHAVDWARRLGEAEECRAVARYNVILLDLMLPDGRGLDFLKRLRLAGETMPVIILTARDQVSDRIAGLNAGADDYLVKPFDLSELSARIGAVTRRAAGQAAPVVTFGDVTIQLAERAITRSGKALALTAREWAVLEALLGRPSGLVSKSEIEERLYDLDAEVESNTIEVYIARLRKKIGHARIVTERGLGYRLVR
ncbi:MAG: DNA-binding response regulator [Rhizobiales bacterium PAR1]|nr:MAG: DNA-binding response regulator [Rhizobiales bacterium PAR1]